MTILANQRSGLAAVAVVSFGQLVSLLGTGLTQFALGLWAWQTTGSATALSLIAAFSLAPLLLLSPVAGVLVDRWNRKLAMLLGDLAAAAATLVVFALYTTGHLLVWHLYVISAFTGVFQSLQWPAYSAAISTMVSKEQYGQANGFLSLAESVSGIAAPLMAGLMIGIVGIRGILLIDIATFCVALITLLIVHIPQPARSTEGQAASGGFWHEAVFGIRYIFARPAFLRLQILLLALNVISNSASVLLTPMILARTSNNAEVLGAVLSAASLGALLGGVCMSVWGGPKRRMHGVLLGCIGSGLLGYLVVGLGRSLPIWAVGAALGLFFSPIINGSLQAIWQAKVMPDIQGRVFAARRLIAAFALPAAMVLAGPVADFVFEPAMRSEGVVSLIFAPLVGSGPGAGMSVMFILCGISLVCIGLLGYASRTLLHLEADLPDHDQVLAPVVERPS